MGRAPCCSKVGLHRGPWTAREDTLLIKYIQAHSEGHWRSLPKKAGLLRCGKSCRLRWMNYLRPDIKRGNISPEEEDLIIRLHSLLGNRWSLIAGRLPGRTDNEIKNYWNTHLSKRFKSQGTDSNAKTKAAKRSTGEPKKRKSNNQQKKEKSISRGNNDQETTKTKIHLPKPVRITSLPISRNNSFEYNTPLSLQGGEKGVVVYTEDLELPWPYLRDGATTLIEGDQGHNLVVDGCDLGCQSQIPVKDNGMLEKLYEEYLQLVNTDTEEDHQAELDSFAESLWA